MLQFVGRSFRLSNDQLRDILEKKVTLHFRLYHKIQRSDVEWMEMCDLSINGIPTEYHTRKTRTAPVKKPLIIPDSPIVLPHSLKLVNSYSFMSLPSHTGYFVIQLVREVPIETVC